jgi:hypothetical protein
MHETSFSFRHRPLPSPTPPPISVHDSLHTLSWRLLVCVSSALCLLQQYEVFCFTHNMNPFLFVAFRLFASFGRRYRLRYFNTLHVTENHRMLAVWPNVADALVDCDGF